MRERPAHRGGWLVAVHLAAGTARHDAGAVFEVGRKYAMEAGEVEPRPGHQRHQRTQPSVKSISTLPNPQRCLIRFLQVFEQMIKSTPCAPLKLNAKAMLT